MRSLIGGSAIIDGNTIHALTGNGILVNQRSSAQITNNLIRNDRIQNNGGVGIIVSEGSTARIDSIEGNKGKGITVMRTYDARVVGNTVRNNGGAGIEISRGSRADIAGNIIDVNGGSGVSVSENFGVNFGSGCPSQCSGDQV